MSFWSDLGKIQPGVFIRRNLGGAFGDAWGSVQTFVGQAAKDIKKNRVLMAVTAPQRILLGAGASLIAPGETKRILSLSDRELMLSQQVTQAAGIAGTAILAPVAAPAVRQLLFQKGPPPPPAVEAVIKSAVEGKTVDFGNIFSPPIFPSNPVETVGELLNDWNKASQPNGAPPPQAAQGTVAIAVPQEPSGPVSPWAFVGIAALAVVAVVVIVGASRG